MIKNDFLGDEVARLGFGAMRLPVIDGDNSTIDQEQMSKMVDIAIENGVNYFDTAYPYHGGMSEVALGKALSRYDRNSYYLATKYPGHQTSDSYDPAAIFEEQLQKCGVDHFDFYLLHNVYEASIDIYTDEKWGIVDYFVEQKKLGRIRHLGFSSHGRPDNLRAFIEYGARKYAELEKSDPDTAKLFASNNVMEFCQIQMNYLDWTLQDAAKKATILEVAGLPIVVMEPLRGGKLAKLGEDQASRLHGLDAERSTVEWSFRWLQAIENVKVILSGMSDISQVEENCRIFEDTKPLTAEEEAALMEVAESMKSGVPCTACKYCIDSCPRNIDIPMLLATFNDMQYDTSFTISMQMDAVPIGQRAQDCISCRACTRMCPQGIDIPAALADLAAALEKMPKWADLCRQREEAAAKLREQSV